MILRRDRTRLCDSFRFKLCNLFNPSVIFIKLGKKFINVILVVSIFLSSILAARTLPLS